MNANPRDPGVEGHLSPEELAVLAEGARADRTASAALEHLARCRSCMSAYADIVRYRAAWLAIPEAFEEEQKPPSSRPLWPAAAGLILVIGIAAALMIGRTAPRRDAGPITKLLERASAEGLVIPGGEAGAALASPLYRSETVVDDDAVRALEQLRLDYEKHVGAGHDVRQLAAGLVAAGQLDLAHLYISEGLARAPADAQLLTLAGVAAHASGDVTLAERQLHEALRASPGDVTAMLDLGLLVAELRGTDQAAPYLNGVIRRAPRSPLAARARAALAEHGRP